MKVSADDVRARMNVERYDTALGDWTYHSAQPCPPLSNSVRLIWDVTGRAGHKSDRIVPTGDVVLIVDRAAPAADAFVCGLQLEHMIVPPAEHAAFTGARMSPLTAFRVFDAPARELTGALTDLNALVAAEAERLRAQLVEEDEPAARMALMENFLIGRLTRGPLWHDAAAHVWSMLVRFHGAVRVDAAADGAGLSARQLGRVFDEQVGVSPKVAAKLLRFERALMLIRRTDMPLAAIAYEAGYADQSHLNRDFKELAGTSPAAYAKKRIVSGDHAFMLEEA